jgi:DNA-binding NarL/FixJ family response regulator
MYTSSARVKRTEVLIIDSKRLRQAGITRLLETWADVMGLTAKPAVPGVPLDACCAPANCEMTIVCLGNESIQGAQYQELIANVRKLMPQALLVVISDREDPQEIRAAFQEGAVGFMPTSIEPAVAFQALSFIRSGGSFFPPSALSTSLREATINGVAHVSELTTKQEEVIGCLRKGLSNKAIARQLDISEATVKVHVRRIIRKFGVANRTQLAVAAMNKGVLRVALDGKESCEHGDDRATQPALPAFIEAKKSSSAARSAREEGAVKFLQLLLRDASSVAVMEIERRARAVGLLAQDSPISQDKAFRRARIRLGMLTHQQARHWYWRLPAQTSRVASDCLSSSASDAPPR